MLKSVYNIFLKDFTSYFRTNLAYFVLVIYALVSMVSAFYTGYYFEINNTNLFSFFYFQPEIFMMLAPLLTMKLWSDEQKSGTIELLLTQPLSYGAIVYGKFAAAWIFCILMLVLSLPLWIYTACLVQVDNLNILTDYFACILLSGAFCAVGCAVSSFNKNPIVAYILTVVALWGIKIINFDFILKSADISSELLIRISQSLNLDYHFETFTGGQIALNNIGYFTLIIIFSLWLNIVSIEYKKG